MRTPRLRTLITNCLLAVWMLSACSVEVSPNSIPTPKFETLQETPAQTSATSEPAIPGSSLKLVAKMPVKWADLNLRGKLVFVRSEQTQDANIMSVVELDLESGNLYSVFSAPNLSWIYTLSVAPDAKSLVMSYSPPASKNQPAFQSLYKLALDGSQPPQLFFPSPQPEDQFLQPEWSPDGHSVYFAHTNYSSAPKDAKYPLFDIYRKPVDGGELELIAKQAFWPRLSRDGKQLVFITSNPQDGKNQIWLADPVGKNARQVLMSANAPTIIDAPFFSPDGQAILFSAPVSTPPASRSWFERLFGVEVVQAHNVPSEWWQVPVGGGTPKQLTHLQAPGLFASLSPDGRYYACYTANSLLVMKVDNSGLRMLLDNLGGTYGSVSWIP